MNICITGGSGGMGEAMVRHLAKEGHTVVFTYHKHLEESKRIEKETGAKAVLFDMRDPASCKRLAGMLKEKSFDGLVNNAATPIPRRDIFTSADPEQFTAYVATELLAVTRLSQAFAEKAKNDKCPASLVNILTVCTCGMPPPKLSEYVTLKYALLGLTRSMAADLAPFHIRVNAISPGLARTNFVADLPNRLIEMEGEETPMGKLVSPEDVAHAVAFLLSPAAGYITGLNIPVTGGIAC